MAADYIGNCSVYWNLSFTGFLPHNEIPWSCVKYSLQFEVFLIGVFVILLLGTVGGNFLVILSVLLVRKLQTPSNFLIVNLAVSDFLVSILVLPGAAFQQLSRNRWPFSELLCDVFIAFDVLLCTSSILNLCAISIDRYLVITRPFQYALKRGRGRMALWVLASWLLATLVSIPPMFVLREPFVPGQCAYSENLVYQIYATFSAFYLPLLVMLVLYGRIFRLARDLALADAKIKLGNGRPSGFVSPSGSSSSLQHKPRSKPPSETKAITTLGVIMGCFTLCWLPFFIIQISKSILKVMNIDYLNYFPIWLIELCLWLGYLNSFLNPLIYVKFNREFRAPFKQILLCHCMQINARVRTENFVQEYGLPRSPTAGCQSRNQDLLHPHHHPVARRPSTELLRRQRPKNLHDTTLYSRPGPRTVLPTSPGSISKCACVQPLYSCTDKQLNHNNKNHSPQSQPHHNCSSSTDSESQLIQQLQPIDYSFNFHQSSLSSNSLEQSQRSERHIYDFGPAAESERIDSPSLPLISVENSENSRHKQLQQRHLKHYNKVSTHKLINDIVNLSNLSNYEVVEV